MKPVADADRYRPQWHFSPRRNWINDPNGLIWLDGEYHLFYQYNPFGDLWGHMSWGHAVSSDLLHWTELEVAIPEDERVSIYSGSIVVDATNSSGLGAPGEKPLVAIYTGCRRVSEGGQSQEIAFSTDRGRTWTKYAGNPVLDIGLRDFRDPKVFWHASSARWVMAVVRPDDHQVSFYGSVNLRNWVHLSDFGPAGEAGGIWECPDLIEFPPQDGSPSRWVLKVDTFAGHPGGTGAQVFIGHFDGTRFNLSGPAGSTGIWIDHGSDFYAALSWANLPDSHASPVWIGWMNNHGYAAKTPTAPWRGAMSVPRELFLRDTPEGVRLGQRPWPGLSALRGEPVVFEDLVLHDVARTIEVPWDDAQSLELVWDVTQTSAAEWGLRLRAGAHAGIVVGINRLTDTVFIDRSDSGKTVDPVRWSGRRQAPLPRTSDPLQLRILIDRCSVEVFVGDGLACLTELFFADDDHQELQVYAHGGAVTRSALTVWPLRASMQHD
jgi:fructan beta-fructosidase